jgi:hypothetical protein
MKGSSVGIWLSDLPEYNMTRPWQETPLSSQVSDFKTITPQRAEISSHKGLRINIIGRDAELERGWVPWPDQNHCNCRFKLEKTKYEHSSISFWK